jgi:hypothetical protein
MSPEENETLDDARCTLAIANAMLAAKDGDPRKTAIGLLACAQTLITGDVLGKLAFAVVLCEAAAELVAEARDQIFGIDQRETLN